MTKEQLQGYKKITVCGSKFVIRKINPILDFDLSHIPQIFSSFQSARNTEKTAYSESSIIAQMHKVVEAGLVEPSLVAVGKGEKKGKEAGITVEDIFRDEELGSKLFSEIMIHSLNRFSGMKKVFFSARIRLEFFINWLKLTANFRQRFPSRMEN